MFVGYVSNECYVVFGDVLFEFCGCDGVVVVRFGIFGVVCVDIVSGEYEVVLGREGYGLKIIKMYVDVDCLYYF